MPQLARYNGMAKTATSQNGDKPERRHLFRETNKITLNTCSKRTSYKRDKLLVVLIVVTLRLIVRFFRLRLCKTNDTILRFQYV